MIEQLVALFLEAIAGVVKANGEAAAEDEALMKAAERLARLQAERKFGQ